MKNLLSEPDAKAVVDILVEQLGVAADQLTDDAKLIEDLGADSLSIMEIILAVEERFGLTIPDERLEEVETVGDLCELLASLLAAVK